MLILFINADFMLCIGMDYCSEIEFKDEEEAKKNQI